MTRSVARRALLGAANLAALAAFTWPFVIPGALRRGQAHGLDAPIVFVLLLGCLAAVAFLEAGRGGLGPKNVALIGVLAAAMVALRLPGYVAGASAMFVVVILAGNAFGPGFGFVLGAIGTAASALFVGGIGPWVPFQMAAVGWVGVGAGLVPRLGRRPLRLAALAAYGAAAGFLFGAIMNLWFWPFQAGSSALGWLPEAGAGTNLVRYLRFYVVTSAWWDAFRAAGNALLVLVLGGPVLAALDRAARRMNLRAGYAPPVDWGRGVGRAAAGRDLPA